MATSLPYATQPPSGAAVPKASPEPAADAEAAASNVGPTATLGFSATVATSASSSPGTAELQQPTAPVPANAEPGRSSAGFGLIVGAIGVGLLILIGVLVVRQRRK